MFVAQTQLRRVAAVVPPGGTIVPSPASIRTALARVDWTCPGLDDEAILCARRLTTRAKGTSFPRAADALPATDLQQDVTSGLAGLRRAAFRPAHESVPAGAAAVLFANRAELLACLALDSLRGDGPHRWWWSVLRINTLDISAPGVWLREIRWLPAIVAILDARGAAHPWLESFREPFAATLWQTLVVTFALEATARNWVMPPVVPYRPAAPPSPSEHPFTAPPWHPWVADANGLGAFAVRVLVTALMLHRAPAVLRSLRFNVALREWTASADRLRTPDEKSPGSEIPGAAGPPAPPSDRVVVRLARPPDTGLREAPRLPIRPNVDAPARNAPATAPRSEPAPLVIDRVAPPPAAPHLVPDTLPDDRHGPESTSPPEPTTIVSGWAGTFYLVNVALALELYGDFTSPARPGLALPVWDFLALCGRRLGGQDFLSDPIDPLLARLSARPEHEPPGAHFAPADGISLGRWLAETETRIHRRLAAALGETDRAALRALVLERTGRIRVGVTRVDVTFGLAEHPIELRLAGLDRDPGWIPAAGRSIAFHYD